MADIPVLAGGDLQAALDASVGGDRILLEAGATFEGSYTLPAKASVVTLTTDTTLPSSQIDPATTGLAKLVTTAANAAALDGTGTTNWTVDGVQVLINPGSTDAIIKLQDAAQVTLDRIRFVNPLDQQQKRVVLGNGTDIVLTRSHLAGIWFDGADSQCFLAYDGAGPYTLTDNYLDGASENILFGGADAASDANIPADILIEGNYCTKPRAWEGQARTVKNILELKAARRVIARNNVFENCWVDAQGGSGIVFTPRNQDGTADFTNVSDVLFTRNIVRYVTHGFNILGYDDTNPSGQTTGIVISQNLVLTRGGRFALLSNEIGTLTINHNTYVNSQALAESAMIQVAAEGLIQVAGVGTRVPTFAVADLTLTNNLMQHNAYGLFSSVAAIGSASLTAMVQTTIWQKMVLAGPAIAANYPIDTTVISVEQLGQHLGSDYRLVAGSVFNNAATDGGDIGWEGQTVVPEPEPMPTPDPDPFPDPEPNPPPTPAPTAVLQSLALAPASLVGGNTLVATVTLDLAAATGGKLIQVDASGLTLPASTLLIPAGATQRSLSIATPVVLAATPVTVRASGDGGVTWKVAAATLVPVPVTPPPIPTLTGIALSPVSVIGGASVQGLVTLTGIAPAGGLTATLSDDSGAAGTPASVTVPAGQAVAVFTLTTSAVLVDTLVTISAVLNGVTRTAQVLVLAAAPTPDPTPDPEPPTEPPVLELRATVTIDRRGRSNTFRVRVSPEIAGSIRRVEYLVDGVIQVTQDAPTGSTVFQTTLSLPNAEQSVVVKLY